MGRWIKVAGLAVLVGATLRAGEPPPDRLPKEVRQAEQVLSRWVDAFVGQTPDQIRRALGYPAVQDEWSFRGEKQPWQKYKVGDRGQLLLYFDQGRVAKALLSLPSH